LNAGQIAEKKSICPGRDPRLDCHPELHIFSCLAAALQVTGLCPRRKRISPSGGYHRPAVPDGRGIAESRFHHLRRHRAPDRLIQYRVRCGPEQSITPQSAEESQERSLRIIYKPQFAKDTPNDKSRFQSIERPKTAERFHPA